MKKAIILILAACALLCGCSQPQSLSSSEETEESQIPVGPDTEFVCEVKVKVTGTDDEGRLAGELLDYYESGGKKLIKGERVIIDHSKTIMLDLREAEKGTKSHTDAELDYGIITAECTVDSFEPGTVITMDEFFNDKTVGYTDEGKTLIIPQNDSNVCRPQNAGGGFVHKLFTTQFAAIPPLCASLL